MRIYVFISYLSQLDLLLKELNSILISRMETSHLLVKVDPVKEYYHEEGE